MSHKQLNISFAEIPAHIDVKFMVKMNVSSKGIELVEMSSTAISIEDGYKKYTYYR